MTYKVVVAEDNKYELDILCNILAEDITLEVVGKCTTGMEAVKCCEQKKPDIVFLDINMPKMSGIEASRVIRSGDSKVNIIFATGIDNYKEKAFEVYAIDYIPKPYNAGRIRQTIDRIKNFTNKGEADLHSYIEINYNWNKILIRKDDILYIECINRTSFYHTIDNSYKCYMPLKEVKNQLGEGFFQVHKSYIINLKKIIKTEKISRTCLKVYFFNAAKNAYISAKYFDDLREKLQQ